MHAHLEALAAALDSEEAWQRREHRRLIGLDLPERVASGVSWAPLRVERVETASRGRTFLLLRTRDRTVLHDGISSGNRVRIGPVTSPDAGPEGRVLGTAEDAAEVLLDDPFDHDGEVALTRLFDPTTFRRYREALRRGDTASGPLRAVLLGQQQPGDRPDPLPDSPRFADLNAAQTHAARMALSTPEIGLVQGPPGTGKTTLIITLLQALVDRGEQPWALADSNAAVDHLAARSAAAGLEVVRIGHPARIGSAAEPLSLDARVSRGPQGITLAKLDRELIKLRTAGHWRELRKLLDERDRIEQDARQAIVDRCDVVACTLGSLPRVAPHLPEAVTAVVDEATQATEPAVWTAVPWVTRLVLVGDPCQLGPVVFERDNPLERSLLDRLLDPSAPPGGDLPLPMLTVQHRMHEAIQDLVQPAYARALQAHPAVAGHRLADLDGVAEAELTTTPALWVDTAGAGHDEQRDELTRSLYNPGEVEVIATAARLLRRAGVPPADIGVITPYSAQVARLTGHPDLEGIEVHTVNAFKGREKEAILCSFVRSNHTGELGFVADERRLTVALSRARRLLLCTGDSGTLAQHARFAGVLDHLEERGALRTVWEAPWASW